MNEGDSGETLKSEAAEKKKEGIRFYEKSEYCTEARRNRTVESKDREEMMKKYWEEMAMLWAKMESNDAFADSDKRISD